MLVLGQTCGYTDWRICSPIVKVPEMKKLLLSVIFASLAVAACQPPPVLRDPQMLNDNSLVTGEPCSAPCWQGITPGETSWNEALTIVEDNPAFVDASVQEPADSAARAVEFNAAGGKRCCGVYSDDGHTVTSVFTLLSPIMKLGAVVEKYGEPTYFTVEGISDDQASVAAVWPEVPMILYVFAAGLELGSVSETSEVFGAVYLTKANMELALKGSALYGWQGYGTLEALTSEDYAITPVPTDDAGNFIEDDTGAESTPEATPQSDN
jgi:hypothetical protein